MAMAGKIVKVECRWDDQPGVEPAWYCEAVDSEGRSITDSQKISWPIDVDDYGRGESASLIAALTAAFPSVDIEELS